jgi:hypothetical protein
MMLTTGRWVSIVFLALLLGGEALAQGGRPTTPTTQPTTPAGATFDHSAWNTIVSTYVQDGVVNYTALKANPEHSALLDAYVASLATADPASLSRNDRLAFWINAYNALVVDKVVELWPIESVLPIEGFFDRMEYRVAGQDMTLNRLEDDMIRGPYFGDPRFHFALVCAAVSCAPLRSEAYEGARLDEQLDDQTRRFVRATTRIDTGNRSIHISKMFEWFNRDFQGDTGGHRAFLSRYVSDADQSAIRATVNFFHFDEYDWAVNGI